MIRSHAPGRAAAVTVGLSGGVDSAVAALLLKRQGYQVCGVFMKNWEDDDSEDHCPARADLIDAVAVAERIGIEVDAVCFATEYRERVFASFLRDLGLGRTPNPDVVCNREIKFRLFLDHALAGGAERIATGHYARIVRQSGRYRLLKGADRDKDQSYFLYTLGQAELGRGLFPLGGLTKPEVRRVAREAGLSVHDKRDSTGICFIGERPFQAFLARYLAPRPGAIRTVEGKTLGEHPGVFYFTLGQRAGLRIGGVAGAAESAWYVVAKDLDNDVLIVAQGHDQSLLMSRALTATELSWVAGTAPALPCACSAKTRYRQPDQACAIVALEAGRAQVVFEGPQRAVTPGQAVVFYQGQECLGGGTIASTNAVNRMAALQNLIEVPIL
ncbi:MAG: tRNA 2-thiouridine(34) synthase MnmA [Gammaproteobacteria bacterium]